jgi:ribulose-5-phosphate 4-epimerase/fuculose-1-phosphate aldolase
VIGRTVAEAFDDLYFLERACQVQILAMSTGRPLRNVKDEVAKATFGNCDMGQFAHQHFEALKRLLDRDEPDYAH